MLALGLASARFFSFIYDQWTEIQVDVPQVNSETPIVVTPKPILTKELIYKRSLISKDRDISQFDNGGTFTNQCWSKDDIKQCEKNRIEARKFILNHWKEKKQGYIVYHIVWVDGATNLHIFIQPNENAQWQIVEIRELRGFEYFGEDNVIMTIYNSAKFKRATKDDYPFPVGSYYLSLLDENGKEIEGL